jgi:hypothetical protein
MPARTLHEIVASSESFFQKGVVYVRVSRLCRNLRGHRLAIEECSDTLATSVTKTAPEGGMVAFVKELVKGATSLVVLLLCFNFLGSFSEWQSVFLSMFWSIFTWGVVRMAFEPQ